MTSARVAVFFGEPFQVEVYDDLSLEFIDHDIAYDQAAVEFGYKATPQIDLLNAWRENPIATALRTMIPPDDTRVEGLALDFAEHAIYECGVTIKKP